ncbi:hypothetical protein WISP_88715 [Willisornis vidua]|uniref:Uncharacterized protein n=1 Tax=Willisornis vidua TaxID=1566151 RepID=A0ABQ9D2K8_9PASS|nr:hypothetical protein WISP_88715 [Willisornis vidua]
MITFTFHMKKQKLGTLASVTSQKDVILSLFILFFGDGALRCVVMTDRLGWSKEVNEHFALVSELSYPFDYGYSKFESNLFQTINKERSFLEKQFEF